jgi:hypothetical protein
MRFNSRAALVPCLPRFPFSSFSSSGSSISSVIPTYSLTYLNVHITYASQPECPCCRQASLIKLQYCKKFLLDGLIHSWAINHVSENSSAKMKDFGCANQNVRVHSDSQFFRLVFGCGSSDIFVRRAQVDSALAPILVC